MVTSYHTLEGRTRGQSSGGVRTDYLLDSLGSVTATVDAAASAVSTYRYRPYGATLAKTGSGADPRFLWTGETGSRATGASGAEQYNRARHYGSGHATWTSVDPLWPMERAYGYVGGNPTSRTDPSGMKPCRPRQKCPPGTKKSCYRNGLSPKQKVELHSHMGAAIGNHCRGIKRYTPHELYAIMFCIVEGESGWNPSCCTENDGGPQDGCLALGLAQETPDGVPKCKALGYSRPISDPKDAIGCLVALVCGILKDPDTMQWIYARKCFQEYNAIDDVTNPKVRRIPFNKCLKGSFNIALGQKSPMTGNP